MSTKLYVGNLAFQTTSQELQELFASAGTVESASVVEDREEKLVALTALSEHMIPGRWDEVREPNDRELQLTTVLTIPINEASAKIRTGPPVDDEEDYDLSVWAGVIPLKMVAIEPVADPRLNAAIAVPEYASDYRRTSHSVQKP